MKSFLTSHVIALATYVSSVSAHGYLSQPKASYVPGSIYTDYTSLTNSSVNKGFDGGVYNGAPANNYKEFSKHWSATGYKSLRDMVDPIAPGYGFSLDTADPVDVSSYKEMWWQNNELKEGFLASHHGPCEGWIDNKKVFHYDDCVTEFPENPAKIPTDYSSCKSSKCLFVFYWLALHSPKWQIYKQCVPITNGGSGQGKTEQNDEPSPDESAEELAKKISAAAPATEESTSDETEEIATKTLSTIPATEKSTSDEAGDEADAPASEKLVKEPAVEELTPTTKGTAATPKEPAIEEMTPATKGTAATPEDSSPASRAAKTDMCKRRVRS
ncbi:hypothetical protein CCR75_004107 [Bremia lactucae]|uniref:Uncharacterized protein n=1 Tax=Bremia lactucae TaxID=4779 RepID=A0A976IE49_BRELC|nr:hypothetical protein CCR75_004107 [Bremia lactucae]